MSKRRKKSSIKPLVPFFVLGVALIAVLIAIFKYNDEDKGDASSDSLTATVDESTASDSLGNTPLTLSDEEVYNIDLMQANGVAMIDPISYDSMADVIEDTMVEFGVDESQISALRQIGLMSNVCQVIIRLPGFFYTLFHYSFLS